MNKCYTCNDWSIGIGDCPKCGNIRIYYMTTKGHYWKWVEYEFYDGLS